MGDAAGGQRGQSLLNDLDKHRLFVIDRHDDGQQRDFGGGAGCCVLAQTRQDCCKRHG